MTLIFQKIDSKYLDNLHTYIYSDDLYDRIFKNRAIDIYTNLLLY